MDIIEIENLIPKENIYKNELMSKYTSFKIGGPAECLIKIKTIEQLKLILKYAKEKNIHVTVIGNGSNILVSDDGIKGIVLKIDIENLEINIEKEKVLLKIGSGVKLSWIAQKCLKEEITGFEFASGIPGTIGGAIRMNAGAHGSEMKDVVKTITYIDRDGEIHKINNQQAEFEYRKSLFTNKDYIIIEVEIQLEKGERVRVHGGAFDMVEGVLLKVKGKRSKRVVIKIPGVTAIAASYIEPDLIEILK